MHEPENAFRTALVAAVRAASLVCRAVQNDLRQGELIVKADASPVTVADLAAQTIVIHELSRTVPEIPLAAEEDSSTLEGEERAGLRRAVLERVRLAWPDATDADVIRTLARGGYVGSASGRYFALDPIDGTKGFLRGEHYAVALGLVEDGRVVAGVLGCPNLPGPDGRRGVLVHAVRGHGTRATALNAAGADGPFVHVSAESDARRLRLCEFVETGHSDRTASAALYAKLGVAGVPVRMDSQAKYAVLAMGGAELYLRTPTSADRREWIWDHAAGVVVVEEAGGRVTDVAGAALDFGTGRRLERNRGIVATNGLLHDVVLAALGASGTPVVPRPPLAS